MKVLKLLKLLQVSFEPSLCLDQRLIIFQELLWTSQFDLGALIVYPTSCCSILKYYNILNLKAGFLPYHFVHHAYSTYR